MKSGAGQVGIWDFICRPLPPSAALCQPHLWVKRDPPEAALVARPGLTQKSFFGNVHKELTSVASLWKL
jgi:hypothetical protein